MQIYNAFPNQTFLFCLLVYFQLFSLPNGKLTDKGTALSRPFYLTEVFKCRPSVCKSLFTKLNGNHVSFCGGENQKGEFRFPNSIEGPWERNPARAYPACVVVRQVRIINLPIFPGRTFHEHCNKENRIKYPLSDNWWRVFQRMIYLVRDFSQDPVNRVPDCPKLLEWIPLLFQ